MNCEQEITALFQIGTTASEFNLFCISSGTLPQVTPKGNYQIILSATANSVPAQSITLTLTGTSAISRN
jgi:hypothetical protein